MKIENQVVSLDLARRLKELGFKQDSYFIYECPPDEANNFRIIKNSDNAKYWSDDYNYSAYTAGELGEILPLGYYSLMDYNREWYCYKVLEEEDLLFTITGSKTEVDARAKMLIYLKKNNLIILKKII